MFDFIKKKLHARSLVEVGAAMKVNQELEGNATEKDIQRAMRLANKRRSSNPIEEGRADIVPWIFYDRLFTASNTTTAVEYDFFTQPISGTKTKQDTNLDQVSVLAQPQHFNTTSLQMYFSSQMLDLDIGKFLDTYYLEFWIGNKVYAEGPLSQFPGGSGLQGFTTQTNTGSFSNGIPSPLAVVDFRIGDNPIGHHILQGQTFKVKVITGAGFTTTATSVNPNAIGLSLLCVLEGVLSRGVQ
jgi:hypothetical protein